VGFVPGGEAEPIESLAPDLVPLLLTGRGPCGLGILCVLVLLGVAERAHPARQLWQQERVVAVNVEMVAHERREARDVVVEDGVTLGAELVKRGVHVAGGPEHDAVEDEAADLRYLPLGRDVVVGEVVDVLSGVRDLGEERADVVALPHK